MKYISSSVISGVEYNAFSSVLKIKFKSGSVYVYRNVPEHVYNGFITASSKGTYFNRYIKDVYH